MLVEQLSWDEPEPPVMLVGVKLHTSALGLDVLERATLLVKPLTGVTVTLKFAGWLGNTF